MNVKRFVAANMRRALELVKQEMGEDAVILSSKRIKEGVEILTSSEAASHYGGNASAFTANAPTYGSIARQAQQLPPNRQSSLFNGDDQRYATAFGDDALSTEGKLDLRDMLQQHRNQSRGLASGKTRQQLAREIDIARRKMEAADRIPFSKQESQPEPQPERWARQTQSGQRKPEASNHRQASFQSPAGDYNQRIEPQVPSHIDDNLLAGMEQQPVGQAATAKPGIPNIHAPFTTLGDSYEWQGPQDLSNYLIYPEGEAAGYDREDEADAQDLHLQALKDEISEMREMLHVQLERLHRDDQRETADNNPISIATAIKATIRRRLTQMGLAEQDIDKLVVNTKARAGLAETWTDVLASLAHRIPVCQRDSICKGGMFAFVGPAGAGKTATISKLASRFVLAKPRQKLTLIVLSDRDAKQSPLVRLGKILDVPVKTVSDSATLQRAVAKYASSDLMLIDTPSCNFEKQQHWLSNAFSRLPRVKKVLVLPANAQTKYLSSTVSNYQSLAVKSCVLTKLDECTSLGEVMSVILRARLPLAYLCEGQSIAEDIRPARGHQLVTQSVALLKKEQYAGKKPAPKLNKFQSGQQSLSA